MATSTFDKTFIITDPKSQSLLLSEDVPVKPVKEPASVIMDHDRSEALWKQFLSHSEDS